MVLKNINIVFQWVPNSFEWPKKFEQTPLTWLFAAALHLIYNAAAQSSTVHYSENFFISNAFNSATEK